MFKVVLLLAGLAAAAYAQRDVCEQFVTEDCAGEMHKKSLPMCASDGNTYANKCLWYKAYCADKTLKFVHQGKCGSPITRPPPITRKPFVPSYCRAGFTCPQSWTTRAVCLTDGSNTNYCDYLTGRCSDKTLRMKFSGATCEEGRPTRPPYTMAPHNNPCHEKFVCPDKKTYAICGSDGKTYNGKCEFVVAQCSDKTLKPLSFGTKCAVKVTRPPPTDVPTTQEFTRPVDA